ncbi:uncharacterized protein [Argopecten irradians]|uniref:uncharacterized protein n=1 Tax=Argopecten irradians TaxID=31199 RepID=UPI003712C8D1
MAMVDSYYNSEPDKLSGCSEDDRKDTRDTESLDKYFRQDSLFRLMNDDLNNESECKLDGFNEIPEIRLDIGVGLPKPGYVTNPKSNEFVHADFLSSNEVSYAECLEEFDPFYVDKKEKADLEKDLNAKRSWVPILNTINEFDQNGSFEDELSNEQEREINSDLDNDSLSHVSDDFQYTDEDLQEVLRSREVSLTGSDVQSSCPHETELTSKVKTLSEMVTSLSQTNESFARRNRLARNLQVFDKLSDDDDDGDDEFVNVSSNVLKYVHFSNPCFDLRTQGSKDGDCVDIWSRGDRDLKNSSGKEKQSPPFSLVTSFSPSRNPISNILPNQDGSVWITFQNSNVVKLFDYHGNAIDSIDVRVEIDDVTSSKDGTLYLSCPRARCIKVLTRTMHLQTLLVTPTYVRGIAFSQHDNCLIACLVPDLTNRMDQECNDGACVIRYYIRRHCQACPRYNASGRSFASSNRNHVSAGSRCSKCICSKDLHCIEESKLAEDNLFKYPFRVVVNSNGDVAVSDHGHRTVLLLSNSGILLGSFDQSNLRISIRHALTFDVNNDLLIVQSGQRNILRIRRYVDCSTSMTKLTVPELESQCVTAAAMDQSEILLVVVSRTLIKVLKKTQNSTQH